MTSRPRTLSHELVHRNGGDFRERAVVFNEGLASLY